MPIRKQPSIVYCSNCGFEQKMVVPNFAGLTERIPNGWGSLITQKMTGSGDVQDFFDKKHLCPACMKELDFSINLTLRARKAEQTLIDKLEGA